MPGTRNASGGRNRLAPHLAILKGGRKPKAGAAPSTAADASGTPGKPPDLSPEASKAWDELLGASGGTITARHAATLRQAAELVALSRQTEAALAACDLDALPKYARIRVNCGSLLRSYFCELGLTPASAGRVPAAAPPDDPFAKFDHPAGGAR